MSQHAIPESSPEQHDHLAVHRRRPRMAPFLATGATLGLIAGLLLSWFEPAALNSSASREFIVMGVTGALVGGLVAAIVFLVVERLMVPRR